MRFSLKSLLIILIHILRTVFLFGQFEQIIIPGDLKQKTIITEPATLQKGFLRTEISASFSFIDRVFNEENKRNYILNTNGWNKSSTYSLNLFFGISNRMEVYANIPFVNSQTFISIYNDDRGKDSSFLFTNKSKAIGFGDLETGLRYQFITEDERRPSIRGGLYVTFPTGSKNPKNIKSEEIYDSPTGSGHFIATGEISVRKVFYPYSTNFLTFFSYHFKGKKIYLPGEPEIEFKKGNTVTFLTGFNLHLNDWIAITNDVSFTLFGGNKYYYEETSISPGGWILQYKPAVFFQIRKFRFKQAILIPVTGKNYSADPDYLISLSYLF